MCDSEDEFDGDKTLVEDFYIETSDDQEMDMKIPTSPSLSVPYTNISQPLPYPPPTPVPFSGNPSDAYSLPPPQPPQPSPTSYTCPPVDVSVTAPTKEYCRCCHCSVRIWQKAFDVAWEAEDTMRTEFNKLDKEVSKLRTELRNQKSLTLCKEMEARQAMAHQRGAQEVIRYLERTESKLRQQLEDVKLELEKQKWAAINNEIELKVFKKQYYNLD